MIDDNYSHGFFIPVISAFLIWQDRQKLKSTLMRPANTGLIFVICGLALFLVAYLGAELFIQRFSMILVIWGTIVFLFGFGIGKVVLLPVAYLTFMIPLPAILWYKIAFPLKLFATKMAVALIQLLNIPVYREGNIIHLTNNTLQVVDACSGMRSLASLLAISAAFALITNHGKLKKWLLFLFAIPIAIFANIMRLTATAALSQKYGPKVAQGFLHEFSGILVFAFAIVLLYVTHLLLKNFHFSEKRAGQRREGLD